MLRTSIILAVLGAMVSQPTSAGEKGKDDKSVRMLKFAPKKAATLFTIGGKSQVMRCDDVDAVAKLLGNDGATEAKALAAQVDFDKESIVLVSWTTSGPPDGVLKHESKNKHLLISSR